MMNYEQKYKEVLSFLKDLKPHMSDYCIEKLEGFFQEIKGSEDEKIRKEIISFITDRKNWFPKEETKSSWLTWLEKQGKQKPADKAGTKFKIEKGKWYVCIRNLYDNYANKAFCEGDTYLSTQDGNLIPCNSNVPYKVVCPDTYFRDWTIQDAKDGDVLANEEMIVIFKHFEEPSYRQHIVAYIGLDINGCIQITDGTWSLGVDKAKPATKEQRDTLMKAMADAGYAFDFEKKELKKIEQKSAWSEEDEHILEAIIKEIEANKAAGPEYDEKVYDMFLSWLKSLKERYTWKPNEEQMKALKKACDEHWEPDGLDSLYTLWEQLKKLREE